MSSLRSVNAVARSDMAPVDGSIKGEGWTKIDFRGISFGKSRFLGYCGAICPQ